MSNTTVVHCKRDEYDAYIGRGPDGADMLETPIGERGWLGNPYEMGEHGDRDDVIRLFVGAFRRRLERDAEFQQAVDELNGDRLGGWCAPKACHGDVIQAFLEEGMEALDAEQW